MAAYDQSSSQRSASGDVGAAASRVTTSVWAEGVGFEPTETHKTSTVFETVPFVHSGILPGSKVSGLRGRSRSVKLLKAPLTIADAWSVAGTNLFPDEPEFTPRPAYQVIEAARRLGLTGELTLMTTPPTRVYLRDGVVYFAERSTDGTLAIRLLVEGVINREQMQRGTVIVNGVEHVGRMFDADPSIDRASVELCTELFTDDVMVDVADRVVNSYNLVLYKRHPSGIDRWCPQGAAAPRDGEVAAAAPDEPAAPVKERPQGLETPTVLERPAAPVMATAPPTPARPPIPAMPEIAPVADVAMVPETAPPLPTPTTKPLSDAQAEPHNKLSAPPITLAVPVTEPSGIAAPPPPRVTETLPIMPLVTSSVPVIRPSTTAQPTAQVPVVPKAPPPPEVDATTIADEVAEAIRRAFSGLSAGT